ncbi:MAG TPA: hypothetical protein VGO22_04030 [Pseudorhizobium sp.]|nr:hypothetical protein [Pseudorhizobium sp.]
MIDAMDSVTDDLSFQNALACKTIGVMRVFFDRNEFLINDGGPLFRRKRLFKDCLLERARVAGIDSALYFETISGYQQSGATRTEGCEWHDIDRISCIDLMDYRERIGRFFRVNVGLLSGRMITYEEKKRISCPRQANPPSSAAGTE